MDEIKQQIEDVNFFQNTVVVKFADGALAFLEAAAVRATIGARAEERREPSGGNASVKDEVRKDEVRAA